MQDGKIVREEISSAGTDQGNIIQVFIPDEFDTTYAIAVDCPVSSEPVSRTMSAHTDLFGDWSAGVVSVPNKTDLLSALTNIGFLLDTRHLVLVDARIIA